MSSDIWFHPLAQCELDHAVLYFAAIAPTLASEFLAEIDSALTSVLSHPEASPIIYHPVRQKHLHKFPYRICYETVDKGGIYVYAIAHHKREPHYWLERSRTTP